MYHGSLKVEKIIIRMPNWLGDATMASGMIDAMHETYPEAKITLFAKKAILQLFLKQPHVDQYLLLDADRSQKELVSKMKEGAYDLGLLLTNSFSSAYLFWQAKVKQRIGFAKDFRTWLLTGRALYPRELDHEHMIETYHRLLKSIGIQKSYLPRLYLADEEKNQAKEALEKFGFPEGTCYIGINPLAAYGPAKCWPKSYFRSLCEKLLEHPEIVLVFFGDASSPSEIAAICRDLPHRVIDFSGKTSIRELMGFISQMDLLVTNDSGPMHLGCALKKPTLALFGSTSALKTGPYFEGVYLNNPVKCSPCYKRECPIDFRCMRGIEVEKVYRKILSMLSIGSLV